MSTRIRPTLAILVAATALLGIGFSATAQAADFTVTSLADSEDPGTLRTAIGDVEASVDVENRIVFEAGLSGVINLDSDLPILQGPVTVVGPGSDKLTVDGGDAHSIFATFGDVNISGLTLKNGASLVAGGAVLFQGGNSGLDGVRIESSQSQSGGGVAMGGGTFTIKDSQLIDNVAQIGGGFWSEGAHLTFTDTTISGNKASAGAGGQISGEEDDSATFVGSTFSNNTSEQAGGGLAIFTPTVEEYQSTKVQITGSTFTGNKATKGIEDAGIGGGAIFSASSDTDIDSSLFENNSSASVGGALYLSAPLPASLASIQNSTFTGNTAGMTGAGIASFTFGLKIDSSTLVENHNGEATLPKYSGAGLLAALPVEISNSIVSGNTPSDVSSSEVSQEATAAVVGSFNLIGNKADADYTEKVSGSDITGSPKIGPLADNGGPTRTMLPAADSPVVNKGLSSLDTDQRGLLRPIMFGSIPISKAKQANGSDIGAVELQTNKFLFGKVKLKKKTGIAILPVILPGPGTVSLKGSKTVKPQSKSTTKPATIKIKVQAKGKALKKLKKVGTVKVKLAFTFQPTGGIASSKNKTIRLAKKKRRGKR